MDEFVTVETDHHVGVLFPTPGLTNVRELRPLVTARTGLPIDLHRNQERHLECACHAFQVAADQCLVLDGAVVALRVLEQLAIVHNDQRQSATLGLELHGTRADLRCRQPVRAVHVAECVGLLSLHGLEHRRSFTFIDIVGGQPFRRNAGLHRTPTAATRPALAAPTWIGWPLSCALSVETYCCPSRQTLNPTTEGMATITVTTGSTTRRSMRRRELLPAGSAFSSASLMSRLAAADRPRRGPPRRPAPHGRALPSDPGRSGHWRRRLRGPTP